MDTFGFQNFPVYQDAKAFRQLVRRLQKKFPPIEKYVLADQINRSCLSIILNIAGKDRRRNPDKDFARFPRDGDCFCKAKLLQLRSCGG